MSTRRSTAASERIDARPPPRRSPPTPSANLTAATDAVERYGEEARASAPARAHVDPRGARRRARASGPRARDGRARRDDPRSASRRGDRELEAQTSIKRGYLNILHAREAIARHAAAAEDLASDPTEPQDVFRRARTVRDGTGPHHVVVSSPHTTRASGASRTGERCAAPNAANGRPGSSTRATSMTPPPSAGAASARPARPASRPTSASRLRAWSSSSATATREEFDRDKLASGLRKALTRRPVADGAAEKAADAIEAELRAAGVSEVPSSRDRRAGDGAAARHRPDRLHPVRQRLPELRGPRGAQARGRHAVRRARHDREPPASERPVRPRHPRRDRGGRRRASTRTTRRTSSRRRSTSTSTAASGSSATTATRTSTSARRSPT